MTSRPRQKLRQPDRDRDGRRDELPRVAEAEPEDVVRAADRQYLDRAELRRRLIEAGG